jgi:hypothetical protein
MEKYSPKIIPIGRMKFHLVVTGTLALFMGSLYLLYLPIAKSMTYYQYLLYYNNWAPLTVIVWVASLIWIYISTLVFINILIHGGTSLYLYEDRIIYLHKWWAMSPVDDIEKIIISYYKSWPFKIMIICLERKKGRVIFIPASSMREPNSEIISKLEQITGLKHVHQDIW